MSETTHTVDRAAPSVDRDVKGRPVYRKKNQPKAVCGATDSRGRACNRGAGLGTDHLGVGYCDRHGGCTPAGIKSAGMQITSQLLRSPTVMGLPVEMEPTDALLWCVAIAAGEVQYLSGRVAELTDEELIGRPTTLTHERGRGERGRKDLRTTQGGPHQLHLLVVERQKAVDRLARFAKMAIDAGVAERQVRLAEAQAGMLAALITGVMEDIGATKKQMSLLESRLPSRLLALEASRQDPVT